MINNRDEFIINYWKYYCLLEDDFIELTRYIDLRESNLETSSEAIIKQLESVCEEFEGISKEISGLDFYDSRINIKDYYNGLKESASEILQKSGISKLQDIEVSLLYSNINKILPFENWKEESPWELFWWDNHNKIKHNRKDNFEKGNLKSLLYALGALYSLEIILLKNIVKDKQEMDIPSSKSKIFYIKKIKNKCMLGEDMSLEVVDEF